MSAVAATWAETTTPDLQTLLDAQAYPPTHTYRIDTLEPTAVLAQRAGLIDRLAPEFFRSARSMLDVGCNKGFFSLRGARAFDRVLGIDTDAHCISLCRQIAAYLSLDNAEFQATGFGGLTTPSTFDRVVIGNVHHYVFREAGGNWSWVDKLASLATDQVLIEGPLGMECRDMIAAIPEPMRAAFNRHDFLEAMGRHFTLKGLLRTVTYTPDRYLMLFERHPS